MELNIDAKKNKLTVDRVERHLFSLAPSFYAIVSGALIGTAINLLTGLIFAQNVADTTILLAIFFVFLSSACFCLISIILEQLSIEVAEYVGANRKHFFRKGIHIQRKVLWCLFIGSLISIIISITLLCYTIRY